MMDLSGIEFAVSRFTPVSLLEINSVHLMERCDTKFVLNLKLLPELLNELTASYKILTIENIRIYPYTSIYYDTPGLLMYHHHQNGKLNRFKLRFRRYDAFNKNFIEVKLKSNKQKTLKKRIELCDSGHISSEANILIEEETGLKLNNLTQTLVNKFSRITLVNNDMTERLTLDFNLSFTNNERLKEIDTILIAEVKQDLKNKIVSPFIKIMKMHGLRAFGISKYCLGMILLNPDLKHNTFKPKLLKLEKIMDI